MSRYTLHTVTLISAACLALAQAPQAQDGKGKGGGQPQGQSIQQLKPNFYLVTGAGGNSTVRVTNEGLIVTDTKNLGDQFYSDLLAQIKTVTNQPVKFAIVTHHHQDHSGNIGKVIEGGGQVVAHENLKKNLETYAPPQGKPASPNVTYAKDHTVRLGGATVEVHHYGPAHTGGDSIVYFPDLKVVQMGDVFVGPQPPNVDFPFGGSAVNWPKVIDQVLKLDFDTAIPGHGPVMTKADMQAFKTKWDAIVSRGAELVKKGTPKDQLLAQLKTDDIGWNINTQQWQQPARLDPFYDELSKVR
jgi:glyoxylase-like metal-dependent hydrolase (beta-lactamase superfamily II)